MRVLIVDDSTLICERLKDVLSELTEIEIVGEARDGLEAVNFIRKLNPDVVILDIRMPKKNGIEVLQDIKKNEPHPIVIVLTNYPYPQYRKKCIEAGAEFFFDKSTEFDKVPKVLEQLILRSNTF